MENIEREEKIKIQI